QDASPVIPKIYTDKNLHMLERKVDTLQKIKIQSTDNIYKLILGGDGDVGKTSMVQRFVEGTFRENYKPTLGVNITKKECHFEGLDSFVRFVIWDLAGQPQFQRIRTSYLANAGAGILVFDVTNQKSFENIKIWHKEIKEAAPPDIFLILVGNKIDLVNRRTVSPEQGEKLAEELGLSYIETSAKTGENVNDAFKMLALQLLHRFVEAEEVYNIITDKESQEKRRVKDLKYYEKIPLQEIFRFKQDDFIPWLKLNISELAAGLDMELSVIGQKNMIYKVNVDILAKDQYGLNTIIFTQYSKKDFYNTGKLIAALNYYDAQNLIWIVENQTQSQVDIVNWLNENTNPEVLFLLVRIELLKFEDYQPIPKFYKVNKIPAIKQVFRELNFNEKLKIKEKEKLKFYIGLLEKIKDNFKERLDIELTRYHQLSIPLEIEGMSYRYFIQEEWSAVELHFEHQDPSVNNKRYDKLLNIKSLINQRFKEISWHLTKNLVFDFEEGRPYQSIWYVFDDRGINHKELWEELQYDMITAMKCLINSTEEYFIKFED
ncbi:MAG: DUF4268 domain-containing protein, partial [Candidatus Lokiarchaeota archaeon]